MFITPALAQGTTGTGGAGFLVQLMPFILIFAIMYFLIIRPQQRRMKEHREMIAAVQRGDTVVTAGGLIGRVTRVINDEEVQVEVSEGVRVRVVRATLSDVRSKSEAKAAAKQVKAADDEAEAESSSEAEEVAESASSTSVSKPRASRSRAANSRGTAKKSASTRSRSSRSRTAAKTAGTPAGDGGTPDGGASSE